MQTTIEGKKGSKKGAHPKQQTSSNRESDALLQLKALGEYSKFENDGIPAQILPGLLLGSIGAAFNRKILLEHKVTHILCCCDGVEPPYSKFFTYKSLELPDKRSEDITQYFEETASYIHDIVSQEQKVLVHCRAGKSRSVAIIMSYLMKYQNLTVDQALELIRKTRENVLPNSGFMTQLREYEKVLRGG